MVSTIHKLIFVNNLSIPTITLVPHFYDPHPSPMVGTIHQLRSVNNLSIPTITHVPHFTIQPHHIVQLAQMPLGGS